jgi:hypothetical protein
VFSLVSGQVFLVKWVSLDWFFDQISTFLFIDGGKDKLFCLYLLDLCFDIVLMGILTIVDFRKGFQCAQLIDFDLDLILFLAMILVLYYILPM